MLLTKLHIFFQCWILRWISSTAQVGFQARAGKLENIRVSKGRLLSLQHIEKMPVGLCNAPDTFQKMLENCPCTTVITNKLSSIGDIVIRATEL